MAFCNACGANIVSGTRFCNKCGAAILASTLPPPAQSPAAGAAPPVASGPVPSAPVPPVSPMASSAAPASGGNALKIALIVIAVIVLVGILGAAVLGTFVLKAARHAHIRQDGDNVKVETPFGSVETTKDPEEAARNLGVDLYPGAQVLKGGSSSVTFGNVHTATVNAETSDSVDKVCSFYKPKYPNAMVMSSGENQCTIVSNDQKETTTISAKTEGNKTKLVISHVTRSDSSSN